jgi:hypothetical protein
MDRLIADVRTYVLDRLTELVGVDNEASDLHHYLLNQDYFIIGTYKAKKWLNGQVFEAIEKIKDYEQSNFGDVSTDLSSPENVANMLAYILGEEILYKSQHLQNKWDEKLNEIDLGIIAAQL